MRHQVFDIFLRWYPLLFAAACFGTVVVLRSRIVRKRTGVQRPFSPPGLTSKSLPLLFHFVLQAVMTVQIVALTLQHHAYNYFGRLELLQSRWFGALGVILTLFGWGMVWISQSHLGDSWRIGIDEQTDNVLKTDGVYRYCRHPIFTGLIAVQVGLFCLMPTLVSALVVVANVMLLEVEIRLEEAYLLREHGEAYEDYMNRSGRWLPRLIVPGEQDVASAPDARDRRAA